LAQSLAKKRTIQWRDAAQACRFSNISQAANPGGKPIEQTIAIGLTIVWTARHEDWIG
jgi:hypothetical protein